MLLLAASYNVMKATVTVVVVIAHIVRVAVGDICTPPPLGGNDSPVERRHHPLPPTPNSVYVFGLFMFFNVNLRFVDLYTP